MNLYFLGICGTFMGGLALLARAAGHAVRGCDAKTYPPMSTQLENAGILVESGFEAEKIFAAPDLWVVGNVISRGNPLMEKILINDLPFTSGPQWLSDHLLRGRHVLAVAGTHGKTTTSAMLAWILEASGLHPSFLIGGVPQNFPQSSRLTDSRYFVIEADEYDTAFFDKRSKFIHYRPRTLVLNNLEFDHADIFPDLSSIETQFHHLLRTLSRDAMVIAHHDEASLQQVIEQGIWCDLQWLNHRAGWHMAGNEVIYKDNPLGQLHLQQPGALFRHNALAAIAAAHHVGVPVPQALSALKDFSGVRRRQEIRGVVGGITLIDDFAHHPTAIAATLEAQREAQPYGRILAVLEPRSNSMKMGAFQSQLAKSLALADLSLVYQTANQGWDAKEALASLGERARVYSDFEKLIKDICSLAKAGDRILVMSNGGFGGLHEKVLHQLKAQHKDV